MTIPYYEAKFGLSESSDVNHPLDLYREWPLSKPPKYFEQQWEFRLVECAQINPHSENAPDTGGGVTSHIEQGSLDPAYVWSFPDLITLGRRGAFAFMCFRWAWLHGPGWSQLGGAAVGFFRKFRNWLKFHVESERIMFHRQQLQLAFIYMQVVFSAGSTQRHPVIQLFCSQDFEDVVPCCERSFLAFQAYLYKWHQMASNSYPPHLPPLLHCKRISTSMFQVVTNLMRPRARRRCHAGRWECWGTPP